MSQIHKFLREMPIGESFEGFYVLRAKELKTRRDGIPFLSLEFGDRSGRLRGIVWDDAKRIHDDLAQGGVVKLRGMIDSYQGAPQVQIKALRNARPDDEYERDIFIPVSEIDPDVNLERMNRIAESIKNPFLKELLESFLNDAEFADKYKRAPGGKLWHHNRIGGLIEHSLAMVRICRYLARLYPEIDRDLLIAGAILHDVGKIEEFSCETMIDYTDRGRLVGHIVLGSQWITARAAQIEDFPPALLDVLIHLILSHQGEFGSPIEPSTKEAFLLHYADLIDSKIDALRRIEQDLPEGENWKFVNLLDRWIYFDERDSE